MVSGTAASFPRPSCFDELVRRLLLSVVIGSCLGAAIVTPASAAVPLKAVRYGAYTVRVPTNWPVFKLASDPSVCVRFDRHAVYLGRPSSQQRCPAHAVGRTEAILVEPLAAAAAHSDATRSAAAVVLPAARSSTARGSIGELIVPARGVVVTATWASDPETIERALGVRSIPAEPSGIAAASPDGALAAPRHGARVAGGSRRGLRADDVDAGGLGFDTCSTPSTTAMSAWLQASPFRAAAIYIGGANSACAQTNLTASWVSTESAAGWQLIPVYVGLQAPTSSCGCAEINPAEASTEGIAAAADAVTQAEALGIDAGNPIYYDMEAYAQTAVSTSAVLAFLSAWTTQLNAYGYTSGVYGSASSGMTDLVDALGTSFVEPDDIWIADWNDEAIATDPYVPAGDWLNGQRLHQYLGGHIDNYGGVKLDIDSDYLDGPTATAGTGTGTVGAAALPDGTFVSYEGKVYRLAGGAPLYVHSWSVFGAIQPTVTLAAAQWKALNPVPANGTFIRATTTGTVYRIAGGAPVRVPSWSAFGGPQPTVIVDRWDIQNISNPAAHLSPVPIGGTIVEGLPSGLYWLFSSGMRAPTAASPTAVSVADTGLASFLESPTARASLSGVAKLKPRLRVTVTAGANAPELKAFVVELPTGLTFSRSAARLAEGIVAWGANGKPLEAAVKPSRGRLAITLGIAVKHVLITNASPAIVASKALAAEVRAGAATALEVIVDVSDAKHDTAVLPLNPRPS